MLEFGVLGFFSGTFYRLQHFAHSGVGGPNLGGVYFWIFAWSARGGSCLGGGAIFLSIAVQSLRKWLGNLSPTVG